MHRAVVPGLVLPCLLAAGCSGSPSGGGGTDYATGGTFTMAITDDRGSFDPYHTNLFAYAKIAYDSLVNLQPDGKFVSGLAEKWSADARTASFTLRKGITCSDGTPMTASQVAAALNYLRNPENQSVQYGVTIPTTPFTVTADDATRTVQVSMKSPFGFLMHTIGSAPIVCPNGLKDPASINTKSDGTGPFVLTKVVAGQTYTFTVRKGYTWGPGGAATSAPGTPAKLVIRVVPNETTAANLLLTGEVNLVRSSTEDSERLATRGLKSFDVTQPGPWLRFNQRGERPTTDKLVRQALVGALDLNQVVKVNTGGRGRASTGLVAIEPNPCPGNTLSGQLPGHDVATAGALLDQAGWTKGTDGIRRKNGRPLELNMYYVSGLSEFDKPTIELIAQQWRAIGVRVHLNTTTLVGYSKVMYETGNWDVFLASGVFNLPSQVARFVSGPLPPKGLNGSGIHNAQYDSLVAKAQTMTPPAACTYWRQAEQALFRDVDLLPISNQVWTFYLYKAKAWAAGRDLPIPTSIRLLR
jgi:peptide/nickel transport system substrate-binding protein